MVGDVLLVDEVSAEVEIDAVDGLEGIVGAGGEPPGERVHAGVRTASHLRPERGRPGGIPPRDVDVCGPPGPPAIANEV